MALISAAGCDRVQVLDVGPAEVMGKMNRFINYELLNDCVGNPMSQLDCFIPKL